MSKFYLIIACVTLPSLISSCARKKFPGYRESVVEVTHRYPDANRRVPINNKFSGTGGSSGGMGSLQGIKRSITDPNNPIAEFIGRKAAKPLGDAIKTMADPGNSGVVR